MLDASARRAVLLAARYRRLGARQLATHRRHGQPAIFQQRANVGPRAGRHVMRSQIPSTHGAIRNAYRPGHF